MPRNGYWVECIPVDGDQLDQNIGQHIGNHLYSASVGSFPDMTETAPSPDQAIEKLRDRLKRIRQAYAAAGDSLPEMDNPVSPPKRLRSIHGWISVYINMGEREGICACCVH